MKNNIEIIKEDTTELLEKFKVFELSYEDVKAVIFPQRINGEYSFKDLFLHAGHAPIKFEDDENELFNSNTPDIKKYFSINNFQITIAKDKKKGIYYEILKDASVVLPVIVFLGSSALTVGLGILTSYIYEKYFGSNTKLFVDIVKYESNEIKSNRYKISGKPEEVVEALKVIKGEISNE